MTRETNRLIRGFGRPVFLVILLPLILYSAWRQYSYSGDDLQYASQIEQFASGEIIFHPAGGQPFNAAIASASQGTHINPRYILEWPTSVLISKIWKILGWKGNVINPILGFRLLAGITGVLFFFLSIKRLTHNNTISTMAALGLVIVDSYWYYSTHLDQTINMVALISIGFYFLAGIWGNEKSTETPYVLGALVLATLYNFTALVTAGVFVLALAMMTGNSGDKIWPYFKEKAGSFLKFGFIYGILVSVIIIFLIIIWASPKELFSVKFWQSVTFQGHPEYSVEPFKDAGRALLGFLKSQITYPNANGSLQEFWNISGFQARVTMLFFYAMVLGVNAIPVVYLSIHFKHLGSFKSLFLVLLIWIAGTSIFNWIWDPGYIKYWILPIIAWWAIVAIFLCMVQTYNQRWYPFLATFFVLYIIFGFSINFVSRYLPQSRLDANQNIAISDVLKESDPNALFISTSHPVDFYITYFSRRDLVAPNLIVYGSNENKDIATKVVKQHMDQHLAAGGPVYFLGPAEGDLLSNEWISRLGIKIIKPAWEFKDIVIYEVSSR